MEDAKQPSEMHEPQDVTATAKNEKPGIPGWGNQPNQDDYTAPDAIISTGAADGAARIYQWDEDYGDVGPRFPDLELELFGDPNDRQRTGLDFSA